MAVKTYNLNFDGYVWKENLPESAGIYLTYTVKLNPETQQYELDELKYIGESKNIKTRQEQHINDGDYPKNKKLAFAYALMSDTEDSRKRCEAALIYRVQPEWNTLNKNSFDYDKTTVKSTGKHYGVPDEFTVERTI